MSDVFGDDILEIFSVFWVEVHFSLFFLRTTLHGLAAGTKVVRPSSVGTIETKQKTKNLQSFSLITLNLAPLHSTIQSRVFTVSTKTSTIRESTLEIKIGRWGFNTKNGTFGSR